MLNYLRIPKPTYLLSQLTPHQKPNATLYQVLQQVIQRYQLGEIRACYRAPRSKSLNFFVVTSEGKFVIRQQRLSEDDVTYEYQVIEHLQKRGFPVPAMLLDQTNQAWVTIDEAHYSAYGFVDGYSISNFFWLPAVQRKIIIQCGRTLAEYHRSVADLRPSAYKWNTYYPAKHKRRCEGKWFLGVLKDIRPLLGRPTANSPIDDFTRSRVEALEQMLRLEPVVEGCLDLSKTVIHGDYAPWNILFRLGQSPVVLDFNEARLDLKIYDIVLSTFWFAWRNGHFAEHRARAFQAGYRQIGQLSYADLDLAGAVFRWVMARSLTERLYKHYNGQRFLKEPTGLERQYQMCLFAEQHAQKLVAGLKRAVNR